MVVEILKDVFYCPDQNTMQTITGDFVEAPTNWKTTRLNLLKIRINLCWTCLSSTDIQVHNSVFPNSFGDSLKGFEVGSTC